MTTLTAFPADTPPDGVAPTAGSPASLVSLLRDAMAEREGRVVAVGFATSLALMIAVFWPNLTNFLHTWSTDENYSHGFLVPLLSLYFANVAARRGPVPIQRGVLLGAALLVVSMLGRLATVLVPVMMVGDVSLLLGLAGVCSLLAGRAALRRYGFALFFLVFMVPLPVQLYTTIASPLQLLVSRVASEILNAIGIPVLCEGNLMTLPGGVHMFVAEACSGMRQLTGFLALTTAVAYLSGRPTWYRALVVASSIPIAMTANVIRVVFTGIIMDRVDPRFASGTFHTIEGLLMMGLGLALLSVGCRALDWLAKSYQLSATSYQPHRSSDGVPSETPPAPRAPGSSLPPADS